MKSAPLTNAEQRTLTRAELADELGLSVKAIDNHHRRSNPPPHDRRGKACFYSLDEYASWMRDANLNGERGRPVDASSPTIEAARLRQINAMADKYELKNAIDKGKLVDRESYKSEWMSRIMSAKNKLIGLPSQLSPTLYGQEVPDIERVLSERIEQIIRELQAGD